MQNVQAYISISFSKRQFLDEVVEMIAHILNQFEIKPFVFVDHYHFAKGQENEMMLQAFKDIDRCGLLIAETSEKAIGIGIEAGYAKAKSKPVIYLRNSNAEHSTTMAGTSDYQIVYNNVADLAIALQSTLEIITKAKA